MWHAVTILIALATAPPQPLTPADPAEHYPVRIEGLEKAVITISFDKARTINSVKFDPVSTPDGPRVRVTINGEITLDATRLQIKHGDLVTTMEARDGKTYNTTTECIPATNKPAPKPKPPDR